MGVSIVLLVWLVAALLLSIAGVLHDLPMSMPMIGVLLSVLATVLVLAIQGWRVKALAAGQKPMIAFHLTRFVGFYFIALYARGILPRNFAEPAGWGDVAIAVLAIVLLLIPSYRSAGARIFFVLWNVFGLLDILMVLAVAHRMSRADLGFNNFFAGLPLSLLPLFVVPVIVATHALLLYSLRGEAAAARI